MTVKFGLRKLGSKAPDSGDDEDGEDSGDGKPEKKSDDLGEASAKVAMRALCKALGIDPESVDVGRAAKAFRALVATCKRSDDADDEESDDEEY